ncbi:hypothetical protein BATDEDRAFT_88235 [Batrachochytrium dendrobatidis JAM81]|uniref:DOPA 4,5-dioxygenase n=2 Tax=Batrachochytrium dendrobatidis TaxID=109871 RepID=F4P1M8_BATDJ|nr:uncharacterized protein BATDEDRAFT_88235 [Batrachochytrium dendrobatidis JAM81]EGF80933.1 hypothetical protein BATDEDRAFT_88235 [Batrachochytrium dendrobatidis JAM81]KAJ8328800.1 hypothetical protein O5D80_002781 [Batrachochytrium dendrobatidis]KAK5668751.1 hypothetical protein QVD99_004544 [Batrachochytrium dendrobatidis]OAJ41658.1 hypothetical protein BDEG_25224 [Batrachochytrium dendrobatidis JEL423]|eukprot:XP_006678752.1 hypothetical protein BATDEDRAFT_88235 [Batrachochytrium dendrobatidis JAM81]
MFSWLFGSKSVCTKPSTAPQLTPEQIAAGNVDEIKEFHFHVYWFLNDPKTETLALALRDRVTALTDSGYFVAKPLKTVNRQPRGPHPIGSYEVWVPCESFAKAYSWFTLNRPKELIILLHPLTRQERIDHSTRAVFLGGPAALPIKLDELSELTDKMPLQYPELGLGYSAPQ